MENPTRRDYMREIHVRTYNGGEIFKKSGNLSRRIDNTAYRKNRQKITAYMILGVQREIWVQESRVDMVRWW